MKVLKRRQILLPKQAVKDVICGTRKYSYEDGKISLVTKARRSRVLPEISTNSLSGGPVLYNLLPIIRNTIPR